METSDTGATKENSNNLDLDNDNFVEKLHESDTNVKKNQRRFTSSLTINKLKTCDGDISIIVKSEWDVADETPHFYNTNLLHNTEKTGDGLVRIIIESSPQNYGLSATNNPVSRVMSDSSDTLRFDIEYMRLRSEEKRLEVLTEEKRLEMERMDAKFREKDREGWLRKQEMHIRKLELKKDIKDKRLEVELMDAKFRETDREGWLKKHEMDLRKLELEKGIKEPEVRKFELSEPKDLRGMKLQILGNLVKQPSVGSEISNPVKSPSENYAFSGEIFINQEPDLGESLSATVFDETVEVEKSPSETQSAKDTPEEPKTGEGEASCDSILKHPVIRDNLELEYGLMTHLISDGVLEFEAQEDIQREGKTRYEQCDRLLDYIDNSNLTKFQDGLRETMQSHLAEFIDCSLYQTRPKPDKLGNLPLDDEERRTINKLYVLLVENIATNEVLDNLLEENCISVLHKEYINGCIVKSKKNRELLDIMRRRSKEQLKKFWELVIKYSKHLKDTIDKFLVPGNTLTLVKINTQVNLTEAQIQRVKDNFEQPHRRFSNRDGDEPAENEQINLFVSGDEIFAVVHSEEIDTDPSSTIVSEEMKSLVNKALTNCIGGDKVIVETLEYVEYKENKTMDENDKNERKIFSLDTSTRMIQVNETMRGVTVVDDKIFVAPDRQSLVKVYNLSTLAAQPDINIPDAKTPGYIAGCSYNKVLYIIDWKLNCIHRVIITDNSVKHWSVIEKYVLWGLSVTSEHNVLVTVWKRGAEGKSRVVEYTSEGLLKREIKLSTSIKYAWQTLELSTDQFIICHGLDSSLHRVCVINSEGEIMKCFGGERGGGECQLSEPSSITIDKNRQVVFVTDCNNNRVVMLGYDMNYLGLVQSSASLKNPAFLYFDLNSDQLIVAELTITEARLLIISPKIYS